MERTVCKGEWAYEVQVIYGAEHFGAFMESGKADALDKLSAHATGDVYQGNRVFDEYN